MKKLDIATSVESMLTALFPVQEDREACLTALRTASVDERDLPAVWAFVEEWVNQQQESE